MPVAMQKSINSYHRAQRERDKKRKEHMEAEQKQGVRQLIKRLSNE